MKGKLREVLDVLENRLSSRINRLTEELGPLEQELPGSGRRGPPWRPAIRLLTRGKGDSPGPLTPAIP